MTKLPRDTELPTISLPSSHFEDLYRDSRDPWRVRSSWFDQRKFAITIAALPRKRYRSVLEPACGVGELTRLLAARCDHLLAFDIVDEAVQEARASVSGWTNVRVERRSLFGELPEGSYDLIVVSEVLYYFSAADLASTVDELVARLEDDGELVSVHHHYRGFKAHAAFAGQPELKEAASFDDGDFALRVFRKHDPAHAANRKQS